MILPHKYLPSTSVRLKQVKYRSFGILTEPNNAEPNHMIKEDKDFTLFFHFLDKKIYQNSVVFGCITVSKGVEPFMKEKIFKNVICLVQVLKLFSASY